MCLQLSLVLAFIEILDDSVELDSEVGEERNFSFVFPRNRTRY